MKEKKLPENDVFEDERVRPLRRSGWLATRPLEVQKAILQIGKIQIFPSGKYLYHVGDPPRQMYGIAEGQLEMIFPVHGRSDLVVHTAGKGSWFAHPAVLADQRMATSARTLYRTVALVISQDRLFDFLERHPQYNREFFSMLHYTRRVAQDLLTEAISFSSTERVARRIAFLFEADREEFQSGKFKISQEKLASLLGLSATSVQRAIRILKSRNLIETGYGVITVLDIEGLFNFIKDSETEK